MAWKILILIVKFSHGHLISPDKKAIFAALIHVF